jgi:dihydroflavonol-4-reductase
MVWLVAPLVGFTRKMISRNVGYKWQVDNSKGRRELGISYRPMETTVVEFFQQMIDTGKVRPGR